MVLDLEWDFDMLGAESGDEGRYNWEVVQGRRHYRDSRVVADYLLKEDSGRNRRRPKLVLAVQMMMAIEDRSSIDCGC